MLTGTLCVLDVCAVNSIANVKRMVEKQEVTYRQRQMMFLDEEGRQEFKPFGDSGIDSPLHPIFAENCIASESTIDAVVRIRGAMDSDYSSSSKRPRTAEDEKVWKLEDAATGDDGLSLRLTGQRRVLNELYTVQEQQKKTLKRVEERQVAAGHRLGRHSQQMACLRDDLTEIAEVQQRQISSDNFMQEKCDIIHRRCDSIRKENHQLRVQSAINADEIKELENMVAGLKATVASLTALTRTPPLPKPKVIFSSLVHERPPPVPKSCSPSVFHHWFMKEREWSMQFKWMIVDRNGYDRCLLCRGKHHTASYSNPQHLGSVGHRTKVEDYVDGMPLWPVENEA